MERRCQTWSDQIPEGWVLLGLEHLAQRGIEETNYRNRIIKHRLMDSLAVPNTLALLDHARSSGEEDRVLKRLGIHRSTPLRWLKNDTQPHARDFFGLLTIGIGKEIGDVPLPGRRTVIWEAVSRTIAIIREQECERDWRRPTREEFGCVRYLMRHPHSDVLLGKTRPTSEGQVLKHVLDEVRARFPTGQIRSASAARQALLDWSESYLLFRIGLLEQWAFLHDEAI